MEAKEYHFQKLTPIDNADISVYEEAITSLDKGIQPIVKCDGSLKVRFSTQ